MEGQQEEEGGRPGSPFRRGSRPPTLRSDEAAGHEPGTGRSPASVPTAGAFTKAEEQPGRFRNHGPRSSRPLSGNNTNIPEGTRPWQPRPLRQRTVTRRTAAGHPEEGAPIGCSRWGGVNHRSSGPAWQVWRTLQTGVMFAKNADPQGGFSRRKHTLVGSLTASSAPDALGPGCPLQMISAVFPTTLWTRNTKWLM